MEQTGSFRAAVPLSVLTAVLGQCITSGSAMPARLLLLQGFPMALGIGLLSSCLMPAEGEEGLRSETGIRPRLLCLLLSVWFGAELWETLWQAQQVCREQFSSMAVLGVLPLLLWAGWQLKPDVFSRSAGVLWWALALAGLACVGSLHGPASLGESFPRSGTHRESPFPALCGIHRVAASIWKTRMHREALLPAAVADAGGAVRFCAGAGTSVWVRPSASGG